jgi:hypothetical protein
VTAGINDGRHFSIDRRVGAGRAPAPLADLGTARVTETMKRSRTGSTASAASSRARPFPHDRRCGG